MPDPILYARDLVLQLSYSDLGGWADQVAESLRGAHVAPRDRVGLLARSGAGAVAGVLGIRKAGATCVPLDRSDSQPRAARVLGQSRVRTVLYDGGMCAPGVAGVPSLEMSWHTAADRAADHPLSAPRLGE